MARAWSMGSLAGMKGMTVSAKACHTKQDGSLICQLWTIQPDGLSPVMFRLLLEYEKWRVAYAELARGKQIPLRYRTGDIYPKTTWALLKEIFRLQVLALPLQREYNRLKKLKEEQYGTG